jgi:uncharacterized protein
VPSRCRLAIKAFPNAPRDSLAGWLGEALKVKIRAPALEGRANDALCAFLAQEFGLPRPAVALIRGGKSRQKLIQIDGLALDEIRARVAAIAM